MGVILQMCHTGRNRVPCILLHSVRKPMPMKSSQPGKACCHAEAPRRLIDTRRHSIHARYIGTFLNKGENELVGLNEYDLYRDLENGYCSSSVSQRVDLAVICSVKDMAHIRTIYLKPVYRS